MSGPNQSESQDSHTSSNREIVDALQVPAGDSATPRHYPVYAPDAWIHVLFFSMAAAVIAMSFLMSTDGETSVYLPGFSRPMPETCTSKKVFGIPCPGCGLTRAFISISDGKLGDAWRLNPASFMVYPFVALQLPWHAMQHWRIKSGRHPWQPFWIYFVPIGLAIGMIVHWIYRTVNFLG
jgi:hypothetical protein